MAGYGGYLRGGEVWIFRWEVSEKNKKISWVNFQIFSTCALDGMDGRNWLGICTDMVVSIYRPSP
jgi:hypothetical protein